MNRPHECGERRTAADRLARRFDPLRGAVWLGAGEQFGNARDRGRPEFDNSGTVFDPVERARRLVSGELKRLADDVRGVCYPFAGP
jgi:hypothetical protein